MCACNLANHRKILDPEEMTYAEADQDACQWGWLLDCLRGRSWVKFGGTNTTCSGTWVANSLAEEQIKVNWSVRSTVRFRSCPSGLRSHLR